MACVKTSAKRNINSLTRKISYWKMPIGIRIVGVPKKPLSITCWRKEKKPDISQKWTNYWEKGRPTGLKGASR
jgi:hypothetical protein